MKTERKRAIVGVIIGVAVSVALAAQAAPPRRGTVVKTRPDSGKLPPAPEGDYAGVTLGGGQPPETKPPPAGFQNITWPGFRWTKSGSEVFLQLTGQVAYQQKVKGHRVNIVLEKTLVPLRNNLRRVITSHFPGTPVGQFRLRAMKGDRVRLEITLRRKVQPTVSMTAQGQYTFLVVSFPRTGAQPAPVEDEG